MSVPRPKEEEVVDSLAGGAGAETELRVERSARCDAETAERSRKWGDFVGFVRDQTQPARRMSLRVRRRVMERLPEQQAAAENWIESPVEAWPGRFWERILWMFVPRSRLSLGPTVRRPSAWPRLIAACLAGSLLYGGKIIYRETRMIATEGVTGAVTAIVWPSGAIPRLAAEPESGAKPEPIEPGGYLSFPATLSAGADGSAEIGLPGGARLTLDHGAELIAITRTQLQQESGAVHYRVAGGEGHELSVFVPEGRIMVPGGAQCTIECGNGRPTRVLVESGRVQPEPASAGASSPLVEAGQAARFQGSKFVIEQTPTAAGSAAR